jgi:hypothetical protein
MKKTLSILKIIILSVVIASLTFAPAFASVTNGEELNVISPDSGYKILVPDFVELKEVIVGGESIIAVVMKTPQIDKDGKYPIFEIVTTDKDAYKVESFPGIMTEGQIGDFSGIFKDGKVMYNPTFMISEDLKNEDLVYCFDFSVFDKNDNYIFGASDINFVFTNDAASSASEPVQVQEKTAKPTSAKVVINGKQVAFEAYSIDNNNYFKLRDLAMSINGTEKQFQVGWDAAKNAINLISKTGYTAVGNELAVSQNLTSKKAVSTNSKIYVNGEEVKLTAYNIGGNNYFKLRDIAKVFDFGVTWDGKLNMIGIDTASDYTEN